MHELVIVFLQSCSYEFTSRKQYLLMQVSRQHIKMSKMTETARDADFLHLTAVKLESVQSDSIKAVGVKRRK